MAEANHVQSTSRRELPPNGTSFDPPFTMSASVHPRRRPAKAQSPSDTPSLIDCFQNMSIRKGETFNVLNTTEHTNAIWDPLENSKKTPSLPGRSTTCPKSLEDLLIGAGERRAAELLARVDKAIETQSKLALGAALNDPEVLPVPSFMVDRTHAEDGSRASRPRPHRHSHSSDSGIGSSVAGSADSPNFKDSPTGEHPAAIGSSPGRSLTLSQITHHNPLTPCQVFQLPPSNVACPSTPPSRFTSTS